MCDISIDNIKSFYPKRIFNKEYKKFNSFYNDIDVQQLMNLSTGTYPATHGKKHIEHVIKYINMLFNKTLCEKLDIEDVFKLLAAVVIHDFAMIHMIHHGNYSVNANETRKKHSNINEIKEICCNILNRHYFDREDYILNLASAHASDNVLTVEEKINNYKDHLPALKEKGKWEILVRIICLVDYLDLGKIRLIEPIEYMKWNDDQKEHLFKHSILKQPLINKNMVHHNNGYLA